MLIVTGLYDMRVTVISYAPLQIFVNKKLPFFCAIVFPLPVDIAITVPCKFSFESLSVTVPERLRLQIWQYVSNDNTAVNNTDNIYFN